MSCVSVQDGCCCASGPRGGTIHGSHCGAGGAQRVIHVDGAKWKGAEYLVNHPLEGGPAVPQIEGGVVEN